MDGIRTDRASVDDSALIKRLNISIPFSPTNGEIRYDQWLDTINYKGLYLTGKPSSKEPGRYSFQLRGSIIKLANDGLHNNDCKDPFEILYALDTLFISLRINPFKTPLNGLELSATIRVDEPERICSSIVSYLNHPPNLSTIVRDGVRLPYVQVEAGHHKLKLYMPREGALRVEVKVHKMQFLGNNRPATFADLVQPCFAAELTAKLLAAFTKIIWKCPNINLNNLNPLQRELYQNGRTYEHWQVRRRDYKDNAEFKRVEKQRSRERVAYNDLVLQHWLNESPTEIGRKIQQQFVYHNELMRTQLYQTLLDICLKRWQYVENLPDVIRLPNHLKLPHLSEIYPLYLGRFPTNVVEGQVYRKTNLIKKPSTGLFNQFEANLDSHHYSNLNYKREEIENNDDSKRQLTWRHRPFANELARLNTIARVINNLNWSIDEINTILSARAKIALTWNEQSIESLIHLNKQKYLNQKSTPLFLL